MCTIKKSLKISTDSDRLLEDKEMEDSLNPALSFVSVMFILELVTKS